MRASEKPGYYRAGDLVKIKPGFKYITFRHGDSGKHVTYNRQQILKLGHGIVVDEILSPGFDPPIGYPDAKLTNISTSVLVYWQNGEKYRVSKKWIVRIAEVEKVNNIFPRDS